MIRYLWVGIDSLGSKRYGLSSLANEQLLDDYLKSQKIISLRIVYLWNFKFTGNAAKIDDFELATFFSSISFLLDSGQDLIFALKLQTQKTKNEFLKVSIEKIIKDLESGTSFSASLSKRILNLPQFVYSSVAIGERTGHLSLACNQIYIFLIDRADIKNKVKKAIFLPSLIVVLSLLVISFIFSFVIPRFERFFLDMDKPIPVFTKVIFRFSHFFRYFGFYLLLFILIFCLFLKFVLFKNVAFQRFKDKVLFKIYFIRDLVLLFNLVLFLESVLVMLRCGINLLEAIDVSVESFIFNTFLKNKFSLILRSIRDGGSLSAAFGQIDFKLFPPEVASFVLIGEKSGNLINSLERLLLFFKQELQRKIDFCITFLQPMLILFVGLIILVIIVAVYLPIFSLTDLI
ncbi:TPA: hypothetical protein DEO28_04605 [Candidatus Dependentiae bacterium]|nr:MAG: Type II secretion system F domain protein [candidate division TM6 bacterium GW2011_GWE2_31_21]KKP53836.1 MAG: Type II secretion system F domain protein [candidate division TM6 bacterium GW2011_GWF2_33_332]HBS47616.1 hypothetical protein [Candidatus Dependentiae bacterium]HBZ73765.1 hypothetical protein [Candidatus Dependentiae bacterium]